MADHGEVAQIIVKDKTFTIPKKILISHSDYFKAMFSNNFREGLQNSYEIKCIDPFAFELVIQFIQDGSWKCVDSVENASCALQCANQLQFCDVQKVCEIYITNHITTENCLDIFKVASQMSLWKLANSAMTCATWNCKTIFKLDTFLEQHLEDVCIFLRRTELNIPSKEEFTVWKAIYRWIEKDEEVRKSHLLQFLTCIDYTNLKLSDIDDMMNYDFVIDDARAREFLHLVKKILEEKNFKNVDHSVDIMLLSCNDDVKLVLKRALCEPEAVKRIYPGVPWFAGLESPGDYILGKRSPTAHILCYDCKCNSVTKFLPLSKLTENANFCVGFRICSVGYCFYIFGGQFQIGSNSWNDDVWSFNTVTKIWKIEETLPENRRNHMMCVVDSVIYLIGGYGKHRIALNSMSAFDTKTGVWLRKLPDAPFTGMGACCTYDQSILVFAGNKMHTYYVKSRVWDSIEIHSSEARSYASAVHHKDFVYLLRSYSSEVYRVRVSITNEDYETKSCRERNVEYFGFFQNNTENICVANDSLFSFTTDNKIKNLSEDTINVIEVIPLSKESQIKYEALTNNVKSNLNNKDLKKANDGTDNFHYDDKEPDSLGRPQQILIPQTSSLIPKDQQQMSMSMQLTSPLEQRFDQVRAQVSGSSYNLENTSRMDQSSPTSCFIPKQGIKIWESKMANSELSNVSFMTDSSSHGCSTLFKFD